MLTKRTRYLFLDLNTEERFLGSNGIFAARTNELALLARGLKQITRSVLEAGEIILAGVTVEEEVAPQSRGASEASRAGAERFGAVARFVKHPATQVKGAPIIPPDGRRRPWPDLQNLRGRGGQLILEKVGEDLFDNPALQELLRSFSPQELIIYGVPFEADVASTAKSARLRGLAVTLLEDLCLPLEVGRSAPIKTELQALKVHFEPLGEFLARFKPTRTIKI